jgi:2'-hydroxyisoflavone reductase
LDRGAEVTLFHRGRHPAHRAAEVSEIHGDRTSDLDLLAGRYFDAVVDTCGYLARDVRRSATQLSADHYTFVSSASVYAPTTIVPLSEHSALVEPPDPPVTDTSGELYGPQKVGCERALLGVRDALVLRAGLIVGPYDPTDRFTYWATRMRRPGPVLAPDVPDQPVQFIDARDLAGWILTAAAGGVTGVFNANGPRRLRTFGSFLRAAGDVAVRWASEDELINAGVQPWSELPLWLPARYGVPGMMDMDVSRAEQAGLTTRSVADTLRDTAEWAERDPIRVQADYGTRARSMTLSTEREAVILRALSG